jgi:outer membrane biogenesis lipoprotein LolB
MRNKFILLTLTVSITLLSACGNTSDENVSEKAEKEKTIPDMTSEYEEFCLNGVMYYKSRGGGSYATLAVS